MDVGPARSRSMKRAGKTLRSRTSAAFKALVHKTSLEARLVQAYIMLPVVPKYERDLKFASVIRYGAYEVRLVERPSPSDTFVFWVELFDHDTQVSIDGGGADDFERALATAEYLASLAEKLDKERSKK